MLIAGLLRVFPGPVVSVSRIELAPEKPYPLPMDVEKVLAHLRVELARLEAAILKSKRLPSPGLKKGWAVFHGRKAKPARGVEQGNGSDQR